MQAAVFDAPGRAPARGARAAGARGRARRGSRCAPPASAPATSTSTRARTPTSPIPASAATRSPGIVDALGPGTAGPAPGTLVVVEPFIGCGHCYACRVGKPNCCANLRIIGVHRDGGFADHVIAPVEKLVPCPPASRPTRRASPSRWRSACRPAAAARSGRGPGAGARRRPDRARGDRGGAGPRRQVFATDLAAARLATAAELGAAPLPAGDGTRRGGARADRRRGHAGGRRGRRRGAGDGGRVRPRRARRAGGDPRAGAQGREPRRSRRSISPARR